MNISIGSTFQDPNLALHEIVERKGIGHPDTIADGIAESISIAFSNYCINTYGAILNHWVDKTLITGALGEIDYGHGILKTPIKLYIFGKMSRSFAGTPIDLDVLVEDAVRSFMAIAVPTMDIDSQLEIIFAQNDYSKNPNWMNPRTIEDLPNRLSPRSNDTSVGIGSWPLSITEKLTLNLEGFFYDKDLRPKYDYIGQDIKVMTVREGNKIDAVLCVPFIAALTESETFYLNHKKQLLSELTKYGQETLGNEYKLTLTINNNDSLNSNERSKRKGYYFVVLGSALDDGEVGVVGRGN